MHRGMVRSGLTGVILCGLLLSFHCNLAIDQEEVRSGGLTGIWDCALRGGPRGDPPEGAAVALPYFSGGECRAIKVSDFLADLIGWR